MPDYILDEKTAPVADVVQSNSPDEELSPVEVEYETEEEYDPDEKISTLDAYLEMLNIADELDENDLNKIGERVWKDYDIDKKSRQQWEEDNEDWLKLAKLIREHKGEPWPGAASIKYPAITQAAIQFSARAYQAIIQDGGIVKGKVIGEDPKGEKAERAKRIGEHMSYQLIEEIENWEEDTDTLLMILSVIGLAYRKTYRDSTEEVNASEYASAEDVVVNYWAKSLEKASRVTHEYELTPNEVKEMENAEAFLVIDYDSPQQTEKVDTQDEDAPYTFLEQHRWWDLDGDGYQEPYIVTIYKQTKKVVRITARWDEEGVVRNTNGDLIRIKPVNYFTKYYFMPSIDGSYYPLGFGQLLGPLNEVINTTTNQLLDAGSLANAGGGFIDSLAQITNQRGSGNLIFKMGEYKKVQFQGEDVRKLIHERTIKEPSPVLFDLLSLFITTEEKVSSVADIMSGQAPAAGTPATTTLAAIEQGTKMFTTIYKRIHRSLKKEFRKLKRLNKLYLPQQSYFRVLDNPKAISKKDYNDEDCDVVPVSNPNEVTDTMRLLTAESLMQLKGQGLNDDEINRRYLEALHIKDVDKILEPPEDTGPGIEEQIELKKLEIEQAKLEIEKQKVNNETLTAKANAIKAVAEAEAKEVGTQIDIYKAEIKELEAEVKLLGAQNSDTGQRSVGSVENKPNDSAVLQGNGSPA